MTSIATTAQVAFMHLPKTGGTSVLAALREHLPPDAIETIAHGVAEDPDNLDLAVPPETEDDDETRQLLMEINRPAMRIYQHAVELTGTRAHD